MLEQLTAGYKTPRDMEKLYSQLLQHMINRSLEAQMQAHLGHERHGRSGDNVRNGKSRKTVQSAVGDLAIDKTRERAGSFESGLVKKRQVRLAGMEEKILALYAKGMTTRDIESALMYLYGVTISHSLIAQVTNAVLDEARAWQNRTLETIYPIVWLDVIVVKAVNTVFPKTLTQLCIVHLVRASLRYVNSNDSPAVVAALKCIYQSATADEAVLELDALESQWGEKYRAVVRLWRGNWDNIIQFFQFLPEIRKVIYTTNPSWFDRHAGANHFSGVEQFIPSRRCYARKAVEHPCG
jgi:transposase-like protein